MSYRRSLRAWLPRQLLRGCAFPLRLAVALAGSASRGAVVSATAGNAMLKKYHFETSDGPELPDVS